MTIDLALSTFPTIGLAALDHRAPMRRRMDRKYIVAPQVVLDVLHALREVEVLHTDAGRWSAYASTYWDTPDLDVHRLAASSHPARFKVRTRHYVDADLRVVEVKTRDRQGRTFKQRWPVEQPAMVDAAVRDRARSVRQSAAFAASIAPRMTTTYHRATLVGTRTSMRATIDTGYRAHDLAGGRTGLPDDVIIETKTDGRPSDVDRLLWRRGIRPVKFSKYTTAMAALHPDLPANRWQRVLVDHFGRTAGLTVRGSQVPGASGAAAPRRLRTMPLQADRGVVPVAA